MAEPEPQGGLGQVLPGCWPQRHWYGYILSGVAYSSDCLHPKTDEMETSLKLFTDIASGCCDYDVCSQSIASYIIVQLAAITSIQQKWWQTSNLGISLAIGSCDYL